MHILLAIFFLPDYVLHAGLFNHSGCFWLRSGLATAYRTGRRSYRIMRKLLVLPLLPATHMCATFNNICSRGDDNDTQLTSLQSYVRQTWLHGELNMDTVQCVGLRTAGA